MFIRNSILDDFNNFALDTNAVELRSVSRKDICLPYTGPLPQQMSTAVNAHILFNVQVTQETNVVLAVTMKTGKQIRCLLNVSDSEMISLLDKFFEQPHQNIGLNSYFLGLWQAHYIDWRKLVTGPDRLLDLISCLSANDRKYLKTHIKDTDCCE